MKRTIPKYPGIDREPDSDSPPTGSSYPGPLTDDELLQEIKAQQEQINSTDDVVSKDIFGLPTSSRKYCITGQKLDEYGYTLDDLEGRVSKEATALAHRLRYLLNDVALIKHSNVDLSSEQFQSIWRDLTRRSNINRYISDPPHPNIQREFENSPESDELIGYRIGCLLSYLSNNDCDKEALLNGFILGLYENEIDDGYWYSGLPTQEIIRSIFTKFSVALPRIHLDKFQESREKRITEVAEKWFNNNGFEFNKLPFNPGTIEKYIQLDEFVHTNSAHKPTGSKTIAENINPVLEAESETTSDVDSVEEPDQSSTEQEDITPGSDAGSETTSDMDSLSETWYSLSEMELEVRFVVPEEKEYPKDETAEGESGQQTSISWSTSEFKAPMPVFPRSHDKISQKHFFEIIESNCDIERLQGMEHLRKIIVEEIDFLSDWNKQGSEAEQMLQELWERGGLEHGVPYEDMYSGNSKSFDIAVLDEMSDNTGDLKTQHPVLTDGRRGRKFTPYGKVVAYSMFEQDGSASWIFTYDPPFFIRGAGENVEQEGTSKSGSSSIDLPDSIREAVHEFGTTNGFLS